jgi:succinate dehydrogenase/fumarate reductase flavoprotein subunit
MNFSNSELGTRNSERCQCDLLVIGGGGAGAIAAFEASRNQALKIVVACKGPVSQSGLTPTGNGGTIFSSPDEIFKTMITAGEFLNDQSVAWFMASELHNAVEQLKEVGVTVWPLNPHAVSIHGVEALALLRRELVKRPNIKLMEDVLITRLIRTGERVSGAFALDLSTGDFFVIEATAIIIATGGTAGELYPRSSNNPFGVPTDASGTGHAMAYLAGAELIDMELMQFVPVPANPQCLNLRFFPEFWKGPFLNRLGDVVEEDPTVYLGASYSAVFVRKLFDEIQKGNGPIYVDRRGVTSPDLTLPIKSMKLRRKFIASLGIDPRENRIEIALGSHFCMGGIRINEKTETTVPGLFAAGEVMGGVHGGLRLAGHSFAQMIVFGFEAGKQAAKFAEEGRGARRSASVDVEIEEQRAVALLKPRKDAVSAHALKQRLQQVMNDYLFVVRDKSGIEKGIDEIRAIKEAASRVSVPAFKRFNLEWTRAIEFSLMIECAEIIAESALFRKESRGCHYRADFPKWDTGQPPQHTRARLQDGRVALDRVPVAIDRMKPAAAG